MKSMLLIKKNTTDSIRERLFSGKYTMTRQSPSICRIFMTTWNPSFRKTKKVIHDLILQGSEELGPFMTILGKPLEKAGEKRSTRWPVWRNKSLLVRCQQRK